MHTDIPQEYAEWRRTLGIHGISFGYSGLEIFELSEIEEAQTGYSRSSKEHSLCDDTEGSWKTEWIVIGKDTSLGDPLILDATRLCIMTAMHGENSWNPVLVANSLDAFATSLRAFKEISIKRESPVELASNLLTLEERDRILEQIRSVNGDDIDMEFWALLLESYDEQ